MIFCCSNFTHSVCVCVHLFLGWMRTTTLSLMEWTSRTQSSLTLQRSTACLPAFSSFPTAQLVLMSTATLRSGRPRRTAGYVAHQNHHHKASVEKMVAPFPNILGDRVIYFNSAVAFSCWLHKWFWKKSGGSPKSLWWTNKGFNITPCSFQLNTMKGLANEICS